MTQITPSTYNGFSALAPKETAIVSVIHTGRWGVLRSVERRDWPNTELAMNYTPLKVHLP